MHPHGIILGLLALTSSAWPVDYATQIKPLLKQKCYAFHGAPKQQARLRLDTVQVLMKGRARLNCAQLPSP